MHGSLAFKSQTNLGSFFWVLPYRVVQLDIRVPRRTTWYSMTQKNDSKLAEICPFFFWSFSHCCIFILPPESHFPKFPDFQNKSEQVFTYCLGYSRFSPFVLAALALFNITMLAKQLSIAIVLSYYKVHVGHANPKNPSVHRRNMNWKVLGLSLHMSCDGLKVKSK